MVKIPRQTQHADDKDNANILKL